MKQKWLECTTDEERAEFLGLSIEVNSARWLIRDVSSGFVVQVFEADKVREYLQMVYRLTEFEDILSRINRDLKALLGGRE